MNKHGISRELKSSKHKKKKAPMIVSTLFAALHCPSSNIKFEMKHTMLSVFYYIQKQYRYLLPSIFAWSVNCNDKTKATANCERPDSKQHTVSRRLRRLLSWPRPSSSGGNPPPVQMTSPVGIGLLPALEIPGVAAVITRDARASVGPPPRSRQTPRSPRPDLQQTCWTRSYP